MRSSYCVYEEKGLFLEILRGVDSGKGLCGEGLEGIRDKGYEHNMRVLECGGLVEKTAQQLADKNKL